MKTYRFLLIIIIPCLIYSSSAKAQNYPAAGQYITNTTMGDFEGTWRWISGIDTFQIYLTTKKVFFDMNGGFDWDRLVGWHFYKKGRTVVESSYQFINSVGKRSFTGGNETNAPTTHAGGLIRDLVKIKTGEVELYLNKSVTPNQLTFTLENSEGLKYRKPTDAPYDFSFTLPTNMVLIKQ